jgi:Uma2 family endonuclease
MAIDKAHISIEDFEAFLAAHPNGLYELIHGEIIEKVPTQEHSKIAGIIIGELYIYLRQHAEIEAHMGPEARFRAKDDTSNDRLPDVSVHLTKEAVVEKGAVEGMPDIAVEIKSPDDTIAEMREKAVYYRQNGSRLVWLIYPEKRLVEVYQENADIEILTESDSLDGKAVLPNFRLPVKNLFPPKS